MYHNLRIPYHTIPYHTLEVDDVPRLEDLLQRLLPGLVEGDGVGQVADNEVGQHLLQCEQLSTGGFL